MSRPLPSHLLEMRSDLRLIDAEQEQQAHTWARLLGRGDTITLSLQDGSAAFVMVRVVTWIGRNTLKLSCLVIVPIALLLVVMALVSSAGSYGLGLVFEFVFWGGGVLLGLSLALAVLVGLPFGIVVQKLLLDGAVASGLTLDEGGLRVRVPANTSYIPWAAISSLVVMRSLYDGVGRIVLRIEGRPDIEIPLVSEIAETDGKIVAKLWRLVALDQGEPSRTKIAALTRVPELATWCDAIRTWVHGDAYRSGSVPIDYLASVLEDRKQANDMRAAVAYALVVSGGAGLDRVRPMLRPGLPPIVVAMIRLASGGDALISSERLAEVMPYLQPHERDEVRRATAEPRDG